MNKLTKFEKSEREYFDSLAVKYDSNYHYNEPFTKYKIYKKSKVVEKRIKQLLGVSNLKILEIGCGTGEYTKHISKLFPSSTITAIDISPQIIEVAKKKCGNLKNVKFLVESAYKTNFSDNKFDVVLGFYILHHLKIESVRSEIQRVLKKDGLMIFVEPNILNPVVYLIKSNKYLKKMVGDSPYEWAINPLTIEKQLSGFTKVRVVTSEFLLPLSFLSLKLSIFLDKVSDLLKFVPFLNLFGGSVKLVFRKV